MMAAGHDAPDGRTPEDRLSDTERQLAETTERYRSLFAYNPHATFSLDLEGRFTDANEVTVDLSGYSLDELLQMDFTQLILPEDLPEAIVVFEGAVKEVPQQHEAAMRTKHGEVMEIRIAAVPVIVAGEVVGVDGLAENITEENALRRELEGLRRSAEEANAAKSMFLANMSHEVRTPLTSVLGATEMLAEGELDPQQHHLIGIIHRSGERLLRLVNDILDVSRMEAGKLAVHRAPFLVEGLVRDLAAWAVPFSQREGLAFESRIDPRLPETLVGDAMRISQVLTNLVGNALKFTEDGGVTLTVDLVERRVEQQVEHWVGPRIEHWVETGTESRARTIEVRFVVRDTGIGVPPERLASLFDSFTQVDSTSTRRYGGAGLGLAICRELVDLMGGTLEAESTPGEGSRFAFALPLETVLPASR